MIVILTTEIRVMFRCYGIILMSNFAIICTVSGVLLVHIYLVWMVCVEIERLLRRLIAIIAIGSFAM